ncbi:MAG: hypothetical protein FWB83_04875 [Treponema sp.]|nr:hypothetical protein [Treponema sp.]
MKISGNNGGLLRITMLSGAIFLIMSGSIFFFVTLIERNNSLKVTHENFHYLLREWDALKNDIFGTEREYAFLNEELDRLEKAAIGVESWLSILKRRRALSLVHPPSLSNYHESINRALSAYPLSQPVAVLASAALIKDSALNPQSEEKLRGWLPLMNDFNTLRLSIHALLGDFKNPQAALSIPDNVHSDGTAAVSIDLALLKILRGDKRGASSDIQTILNDNTISALRFAAEYNYDFGDLIKSAQYFADINDDAANIRQADALYLAGFIDSAKIIWSMMPGYTCLYNMAVTTDDPNEQRGYLERLVNIEAVSSSVPAKQFGMIRYSRFLERSAALSFLQNISDFPPGRFPYIDLEIVRRTSPVWNIDRRTAETWLLLDRHGDDEELYRWAAWNLFIHRKYDETAILLERLDRLQIKSRWAQVFSVVQLMYNGYLSDAQEILSSIPDESADWSVYANLGRILEEMRMSSRALEQYELASAKVRDNKTASLVQMRIARCFTAMNRPMEVIRVLQYAADLDPDNMSAGLELQRLGL